MPMELVIVLPAPLVLIAPALAFSKMSSKACVLSLMGLFP